MKESALLALAVALGLRHGVDPDHLSAIDALSRLRPSRWNGVIFALGHGFVVTLLAVGIGGLLARTVAPYAPWLLIALGMTNLWRLFRPAVHRRHPLDAQLAQTSPLLLGVLFGAGFETSSQLSVLFLAGSLSPFVVGAVFTIGMVLVDGVDGYMASRTQTHAMAGGLSARRSSRALGILVVISSFLLGGAELLNLNIDALALPIGITLFVVVLGIRILALREREASSSNRLPGTYY
jgi:nickel/cobalt transporter (NiCoT) family protein